MNSCTNINNYLLTKSEVLTGKSETLPYRPGNNEVNTARSRFEIFPLRLNI